MGCGKCDECTAWNPFPWIDGGHLCEWNNTDGNVISLEQRKKEVRRSKLFDRLRRDGFLCPTTSSEDSDRHTQNNENS